MTGNMIKYRATFSYETPDGKPTTGIRDFTYSRLVTDTADLLDLAEHMIGILVSNRRLYITSVRQLGTVVKTDFV